MKKFVEISNVTKDFSDTKVLRGVSLSLSRGDRCVIQGASGSGKSTLLYLLGGLDRPTKGNISFNGKNLNDLNDEELASYRNRSVGFIFQHHFLLPSLDALDNILLPSRIGGVYSKELKSEILKYSETLNISHCLKKLPHQLSGGEQQRVNVLRAVSLKPKLLLCDEPTGNLDSNNSELTISLILDLSKKLNQTLVMVTHDSLISERFSLNFLMKDGVIT